MSSSSQFLTEDESAEFLKVSRRTFQRWRTSGDGPPYCRLGARRVAYRRDDLEAWAASRRFRSTSEEDAAK